MVRFIYIGLCQIGTVASLVQLITTMQTLDSAEHSGSITASTSLVRRVKSHDQDAWRRLARIYGPLVYCWGRTSGLQAADAEDIVGEVFADLVRGIDRFQHDGSPHSFRRWLRIVAFRKVRKHARKMRSQPVALGGSTAEARLHGLPAQSLHEDAVHSQDEADWVRQRAMKILQDDFSPAHWEVFRRTVLDEESPADQ